MLRSRVLYGVVLAGALLFHIFNTSYIAYFIWKLALFTPLAAFAVSLPAMLGSRIEMRSSAHGVMRGDEAEWEAAVVNRFHLPVSHLTFVVKSRNCLTGQTVSRRIKLGQEQTYTIPAPTAHCGRVECRITRVRVCDCLGLFAIRRPSSLSVLTVLPVPYLPASWAGVADGAEQGGRLRPRPGGGPGEDYDLRAYRPGDPIRSVHWKLSSKRDMLVVKEVLEASQSTIVLTFEHFGPLDQMDNVLDQVDGLCRTFLEKQRPCYVQWVQPVSGEIRCYRVCSSREREAFLAAALADPALPDGHSVLETALQVPGAGQAVCHLHVVAEKENHDEHQG